MKLKTLLKDIPIEMIKGAKDIEITGISSNSKCVAPGDFFISKKGSSGEGYNYIAEAVSGGSSAILTDMYNPFLNKTVQVIHKDVCSLEGKIARNFYGDPSSHLLCIGITGTNGKTTCSFLIKHLLDALNYPCGVIGTVEYIVGKTRYKATLTTPDVITNQRLLREMISGGCKAAVMEVSSHALEQKRVNEIAFDVGIFTNLSFEHLDYHGTMKSYADAKKKLFSHLSKGFKKGVPHVKAAIVNNDSPWSQEMVEGRLEQVLTYGFSEGSAVRATDVELSATGSSFKINYKGDEVLFTLNLLGRFNISNALVAISLGILLGIPLQKIASIMKLAIPVQGRLERVINDCGLNIYVDFAHKDDALKNVLECLQDLKNGGKIITVFGCGGNRDRSKRPKMAAVAEELSDIVIVTSDNPRDEDPKQIIAEIVSGFKNKGRHLVEEDRRSAIACAIHQATPDDIILIAGKGHETYQIFAHKTIEFDDRLVAFELCKEKK